MFCKFTFCLLWAIYFIDCNSFLMNKYINMYILKYTITLIIAQLLLGIKGKNNNLTNLSISIFQT